MKKEPAKEELAELIGREVLETLIAEFNHARGILAGLKDKDIVHDGPYRRIKKIMKNMEALTEEGWLESKIYQKVRQILLPGVFRDPGFALCVWLKNQRGPVKDIPLDILIHGLIAAARKRGKPRYGLVSDFLNEQNFHPRHRPDSEWTERNLADHCEEIKAKDVSFFKGILGRRKPGEKFTVVELEKWYDNFSNTVFSVNPGPMSTVERQFHEAISFKTLKTAVSKGFDVGRAKTSSKK